MDLPIRMAVKMNFFLKKWEVQVNAEFQVILFQDEREQKVERMLCIYISFIQTVWN